MFNLLFTLLIWVIFAIIFLSNKRSKLNRSCFAAGILFSLGVFKEFVFFDLAPVIVSLEGPFTPERIERIYSLMTWVLYLGAMPAALLFALFFAGIDRRSPAAFKGYVTLLPFLMLGYLLFFPPFQTRALQLTSRPFWIAMTAYNLLHGIAFTICMILGVRAEFQPLPRRQKRLVLLILLPPIWYWLITIFVIHTLGIRNLFKLWQGNAAVLLVILGLYFIAAFREGIMGLKLRYEIYQWDKSAADIGRGADYINHALKNELVKIEWCMKNLKKRMGDEPSRELDIIKRSTDQLQYIMTKTRQYSSQIHVEVQPQQILPIIQSCVNETKCRYESVEFIVHCGENAMLECDATHIFEVLSNLVNNAVEAMDGCGTVTIAFEQAVRANRHSEPAHILCVSDSGPGIPREDAGRIFEAYHSSKNASEHIGLGLFYCSKVMEQHGGSISAENTPGAGARFCLHFPARRLLA